MRTILAAVVALSLALAPVGVMATPPLHPAFTAGFCAAVGGESFTHHPYDYPDGKGVLVVGCETETETEVYTTRLDTWEATTAPLEALFAQVVTEKSPVVVIFDTDGKEGQYEHQVRAACKKAGIRFVRMLPTART